MLRTKRSACAFRFGDLGGSFTDWTPVVRNGSYDPGPPVHQEARRGEPGVSVGRGGVEDD